jgi:hypothetical protein
MEDYPALHRYSDDQAQRYEAKRFSHARGKAVDAMEWLLPRESGVRGSVGDSNRAFPGAGLGLALSRRLARAATGDVVARASGHGGRFIVRLPSG